MRKKEKKVIFPIDIEDFHPSKGHKTDSYYADVANKIYNTIKKKYGGALQPDIDIKKICLRIALYFEDVCSDLGYWHCFRKKHLEMYGKLLPFGWGEGDSLDEDFSLDSVQFIVWLEATDQVETETVRNPHSKFVEEISQTAYDILEIERKNAPANEYLLKLTQESINYDTCENIIFVFIWLTTRLYLSCWNMNSDKITRIADHLSYVFGKAFASSAIVVYPFKAGCTPLSLQCQDFFADVLEYKGKMEQSKKVRSIKATDFQFWKIVERKDDSCVFEGLDGQRMEIKNSAFEEATVVDLPNYDILCGQFVDYGEEQFCNGLSGLYTQETWDKESGYYKIDRDIDLKYQAFSEKQGTKIFFFDNVDELIEWNEKNLQIEGLKNSYQRVRERGGEFLLFMNSGHELEITSAFIDQLKSKDNPFYNPEDESLVCAFKDQNVVSSKLLRYWIDNGFMTDARYTDTRDPERGHRTVQENLDFMYRCYRRELE